jgi:hypothetical protein
MKLTDTGFRFGLVLRNWTIWISGLLGFLDALVFLDIGPIE